MALAWTLRDARVTSTLIGASSVAQLEQNLAALDNLGFSQDELDAIDGFAPESAVNIWSASSDALRRRLTAAVSAPRSAVAGRVAVGVRLSAANGQR